MEDGEVVYEDYSAQNHPAKYDQQVALARDLLPKAKAFVLSILVPADEWTEENQVSYNHIMIGETPGISLLGFLNVALEDICETANDLIQRELERVRKEAEGE